MALNFIVGDRILSEEQLLESAAEQQAPQSRRKPERDSYFKGWVVKGFRPGQIENARKLQENEIAAFDRLTEEQQRRRKPPKPFNLNRFLSTGRRTALRAKPYELKQAAQQRKELAERAGWEHVILVEVKRESAT